MVEVCFVDGTSEIIEAVENTYIYDKKSECFWVLEDNGKHWAMFPREFVKSVRYVEIN